MKTSIDTVLDSVPVTKDSEGREARYEAQVSHGPNQGGACARDADAAAETETSADIACETDALGPIASCEWASCYRALVPAQFARAVAQASGGTCPA